jgi:AAA15 family ATPase/GTPase
LSATCEGSDAERQQQALRQIAQYLHRLDMRITELRLTQREPSSEMMELMDAMAAEPARLDKLLYELQTVHQSQSGNEVLFSLGEESKGTRRLIGLLGVLLAALRAGRTVLIDELDDSLHSLLVIEIVRMFKSRRINPNGAQLVFTVHNTDLLAEKMLGLSEVAIVSQRGFDGARLLRLTDVPGLRNAENFRRLYLKGHLGGIPSPYV